MILSQEREGVERCDVVAETNHQKNNENDNVNMINNNKIHENEINNNNKNESDRLIWLRSKTKELTVIHRLWPFFVGVNGIEANDGQGSMPVLLWTEQRDYLRNQGVFFPLNGESQNNTARPLKRKFKKDEDESEIEGSVIQHASHLINQVESENPIKRTRNNGSEFSGWLQSAAVIFSPFQIMWGMMESFTSWLAGNSDDKVNNSNESGIVENQDGESQITTEIQILNHQKNTNLCIIQDLEDQTNHLANTPNELDQDNKENDVPDAFNVPNQENEAKNQNHCHKESTSIRLQVFTALQQHYFLGPGDSYGGDYCIYKGDPSQCHSSCTVRAIQENKISARDLLSFSRVQNQVAKSAVLAFIQQSNTQSNIEPAASNNSSVSYIVINFKDVSERM